MYRGVGEQMKESQGLGKDPWNKWETSRNQNSWLTSRELSVRVGVGGESQLLANLQPRWGKQTPQNI